jgi:carboxyl-terminal processing protease
MKRRSLFWFLVLFISLDVWIGLKVLGAGDASDDSVIDHSVIAAFTRALQVIRNDYVDGSVTSYQKLIYSALHAMLQHLDPHSQFIEPDDLKDRENETKGEFGGFGFTVSRRDQAIVILATMENSPSAQAGIMPGDHLVSIDGKPTENMSGEELDRLLKGQIDQTLKVSIYRPSTKGTREVELRRALIKVPSVVDSRMISIGKDNPRKIAYLRIAEFTEPTAHELSEKLDSMEAQGMQALIIDLRNNPGGLLTSAVDVCGVFLPSRTLVAYTEGRDPAQRREYYTGHVSKQRLDFPIAILVNGLSASGAEVVAGALKDLKRAVVVGETTFGKGVVQSQMPLPDGSALWLTTAKYYTPSKQVIQERGIAPDIEASLNADEERAVLLRQRHTLLSAEDQKLVDQAPDPQLDRAVDTLNGYLVYLR